MDIITYALLKKKIDNITSFSFKGFKKVSFLPITGDPQYIYLLPRNDKNYDEYLWIDNRWEVIGSVDSQIDPSYYYPTIDEEGNLTWTPSQNYLPAVDPVNIKGPAGKSIIGPAGTNGRSIELRTTSEAIEWKLSSQIELKAFYNSLGTKAATYSGDVLTSIGLLNCPNEAVYGKIKTITGYGVNNRGENIANVSCTESELNDCPFLGGFAPAIAEIVLSETKEIRGHMDIAVAQAGLLKLFGDVPVTNVNKIQFWIYFLDANKQPLGEGVYGDGSVLLDLLITERPNDWKTLISLKELQALPLATETQIGGVKLYSTLGAATDGTISQNAITQELNKKVEMQMDADKEILYLNYKN